MALNEPVEVLKLVAGDDVDEHPPAIQIDSDRHPIPEWA